MRSGPTRRLPAVLLLLAVSASLSAALTGSAAAAPIDDKKALAVKLEGEINANAERGAALYEQIKATEADLAVANQTIADAQTRIEGARAETDRLEGLVRQRAAAVYRSASNGGEATIFQGDVATLSAREKYSSAASRRDDELMGQLRAARSDLEVVERDAAAAKQAAETQKAALDAARAEFDASQAERQRLLGQVQGEIKTLVDEEAARRRAATAPKNLNVGNLPVPGGGAGTAVAFARAQVGKPYCYAGTGPDCFDCSGLTQASWGQAGVAMAHNSEAQHSSFPRVPMDQVAPGDIVWFPGHVGIYVGGGTVVDAGNENSGVRYSSLGMYQDAVRPG